MVVMEMHWHLVQVQAIPRSLEPRVAVQRYKSVQTLILDLGTLVLPQTVSHPHRVHNTTNIRKHACILAINFVCSKTRLVIPFII